jgi:hypothetical protein
MLTVKPNFYTLMVFTITLPLFDTVHAQTTSNNISSAWYNQALKSIQQLEYEIKPVRTAGYFSAATITSRTGFSISPDGYKVTSMQQPNRAVAFNLKGIERSSIQWTPDQFCAIAHKANELSYQFNNVAIQCGFLL